MAGQIILHPGTKRTTGLPSKVSRVDIEAGGVVSIQTPGAGGYGDPKERDPRLIAKDVREGKVSPQKAREDYGFEIKGKE